MNHLTNVSVVEVAVSNVDGESHFDFGISAVAGHLATSGGVVVRTITRDHEIDCGALPTPDYIKIDAEGAELSILEGARNMLIGGIPRSRLRPTNGCHSSLPFGRIAFNF